MKQPGAIPRVVRAYLRADILPIAEAYRDLFAASCERVEIAGSLRREAEHVKDIELVAVPRWVPRDEPVDRGRRKRLLRSDTHRNLLHEWALADHSLQWVTPQCVPKCAPDPDGHAWFALVREDGHPQSYEPGRVRPPGEWVKLDIFICEPHTWGKHLLIRTGPAEYSAAVFAWAKRAGYPQLDHIPHDGAYLEEEDVYANICLGRLEPRLRDERAALSIVGNLGHATRIGLQRARQAGGCQD